MDALPPGTMLGQYKLVEANAVGGFGILYRAWDNKLNRPVAVKECFPVSICHRNPATGEVQPHSEALRAQYDAVLTDLYAEAQTLSGLHHARVVPVYDIFRAAGSLFYVMPWLEGGSLRDKMAAEGRIPEAQAAEWLLEILPALEYLHSRQIIHRDIKPGNIMFDGDGNPVLVDFGSALNRATKVDTTTQGEFSPVYASPEQISGKGKIGPWTDLYSLAATWYEVLSGMQPEPAQQRLLQDDVRPLPAGSSVLEQSIMQNLALAAADRCQSAREWMEWLMAGKSPIAVARKQRSLLRYAVPLAIGGLVAAFYLGSQSATAPEAPHQQPQIYPPEPTGAPGNLDEFYESVCQKLELHQLQQQLEAAHQRYKDIEQNFMKEAGGILDDIKGLERDARAPGSLLGEFQNMENRLQSLRDKALDEIDRNVDVETKLYSQITDKANNPDAHYPWKNQQEFLMLKKIQPRLEKEFESGINGGFITRSSVSQFGIDACRNTKQVLMKRFAHSD